MRSLRARSTLLALVLGLFPLVVLPLLTGATPAAQASGPVTFTVDSTADTDHSGACNPGVCTLRDALNAANAHAPFADMIHFAPGLSGTIALTASLPAIIDDVTIDGSGHALTIDGAGTYQVLSVTVSTHVSLNALTIADGLGSNCGGLTCGGGIHNSGTLTVTNSAFVNNTAYYGAGIWNFGALTVTNSTFGGGIAYDGGGIWSGDTFVLLTVANTTFSGNTAADAGGGLFSNGGKLTVAGSTFTGNSAYFGGGLANNGGLPGVTNSTFYNNTAHTAGGGLFNQSGTLTVTNNTFYSNIAPVSSGGGLSNAGTLLLQDTLIANNLGGDCAGGGALTADSHNLADDFNCASATVTDTAHLNLLPLQNYGGSTATMALGPGSAAIDAGDDATCAPTDQRGVARPQGAHCDVGAYERVPAQPGPSFIVTRSADTDGGVCAPAQCTLREALNAANAHSGAATIMFSIPITDAGCIGPACTIALTSLLPAITGKLTIDGSGQPITVSGANSYTVLTVNSGAHVSLNALTIANAYSSFSDGGGLFNNGGAMTVTNSTFYSNTAPDGGGLRNSGTLSLINSTFYSNTADTGGGLVNYGTLTVTNSTFYSNTASNVGGGLYNGGTLTVTNSTFYSNTASTLGGGLANAGTLTVTNSTFYSNTASVVGGGIHNNGTLLLQDTLIAGNLGGDCAGTTFTADKYNLATSACANATVTDTAHVKLGPLANNGGNTLTLALLAGSAAIDAGNDAVCPRTDQRGVARPQGKHCDVGAYEFVFNHLYLPLVNK